MSIHILGICGSLRQESSNQGLIKLAQKLANQGFADRAPAAIVVAEQERFATLEKAIAKSLRA